MPSTQQENPAKNENATTLSKIHDVQEDEFPKFDSKVRTIKIEITKPSSSEDFVSEFKNHTKKIFDQLTDGYDREKDLTSFAISTDSFEIQEPDNIFKPIAKLDHKFLEILIKNKTDSKIFDVGDSFEIRATCVKRTLKCDKCQASPACTDTLNHIRCDDCLCDFKGEQCFENHLGSVCSRIIRLNKQFNIEALESVDMQIRCRVCQQLYKGIHQCYMQSPVQFSKPAAFLFYDFETMQEKNIQSGQKLHEVNLCVAQVVCHECFNFDSTVKDTCEYCEHGKTYVFKKKPVEELLTFARTIKLPANIKQLICIAHNSSEYDGQFILKYLVQHTRIEPFLALNGTSIMYMSFKNYKRFIDIKFIDSQNYFDMKLAKLPETFGFENQAKKGYFPYPFNTKSNRKYAGPLPDKVYYDLDNMDEKELSVFEDWHNKLREENYHFDFKKELVDYCRSDVNILRKACYKFRKMFLKLCEIDPFTEGATMASVCSKIFRLKFLKPDSIGIIPVGGYRRKSKATRSSVEWLLVVEKQTGKPIEHIARGSEHRVDEDIVVDGYLREDDGSQHVYQFYECKWHGCPKCFEEDRDEAIEQLGDSYDSRYRKTIDDAKVIREKGYVLTEMWECEFELIKQDSQQFLLDHPLLMNDAMNPRDAYFGGRIETYASYRQTTGDEKIHYIDICSLYPYVNKYGKVPIGHPEIYFGDNCKFLIGIDSNDLSKVEGLVKCRVLPPRDLYHPVLPARVNNRTIFSLCRTCSENLEKGDCHHENIADREFTGTWVSDELKKAVEMGYRITKIYEIWQYEVEQYDPATKTGGIFTDYVNTFLKLKQSNSGWPVDCSTEADRQRYVDAFKQREGIELKIDKVVKNPGLRFIGKRALNCLHGKFGHGEYNTTEVLRSSGDLRDILNSSEINLVDLQFIDQESACCKWMPKDEYVEESNDNNVAIAVYTTAQARLKLYSYLERLKDRVLYCHTDSCVYVGSVEKGQEKIETGDFLGDMTDELAEYGEGSYVREFVSCGPTLYSMIVVKPDGSEENIRKGIPASARRKDTHTHERLKQLALGEVDTISHTYNSIRKTKSHDVVTCVRKTSSKRNFSKRRLEGACESYPFGYKKIQEN